jgi:hypothetical protein
MPRGKFMPQHLYKRKFSPFLDTFFGGGEYGGGRRFFKFF